MFGIIYFLLFVVWVYVMNNKIHHGPDPIEDAPSKTKAKDLMDIAANLADHGGESMTDARDNKS